ncbi:MAG: response regulator transcription factor [Microthrixaceae bacterium]
MRIVIAEDSVLLRAGLTRFLTEGGEEIVAAVGDAVALVEAVERHRPDLAVVDVRMPPTHTDDGLRAALEIRRRWPAVGILVLSQYVEERYASELLAGDTGGIGYLLKDRIADVGDFLDAVRRVGSGGAVLDPEVVAQILARSRRHDPIATLTPRERGALADGGGSQQRCDRRGVGRRRRRGREAREQHLPEARADTGGGRPPSGARRAALARGVRGCR